MQKRGLAPVFGHFHGKVDGCLAHDFACIGAAQDQRRLQRSDFFKRICLDRERPPLRRHFGQIDVGRQAAHVDRRLHFQAGTGIVSEAKPVDGGRHQEERVVVAAVLRHEAVVGADLAAAAELPAVDNLAAGEVGDEDGGLDILQLFPWAETDLKLQAAVFQDAGVAGRGRKDLQFGQPLRRLKAEGAPQLQGFPILSQLNCNLLGAAGKLLGGDRSAADRVLAQEGDRRVAVEQERLIRGGAGAGNDDEGGFAGGIFAYCGRIAWYAGRGEEQLGIAVGLDNGEAAQVGCFGHPLACRQRGGRNVQVDIGVVEQALCQHGRAVALDGCDRGTRADEGDAACAMRVADRDGEVAMHVAVGDDRAVRLHFGEKLAEDQEEVLRALCLARQRGAGSEEVAGAARAGVTENDGVEKRAGVLDACDQAGDGLPLAGHV